MKTPKIFLCSLILFSNHLLFGQNAAPKRMAVLPFSTAGVDETSAQTAESILRLEIGRLQVVDVIAERQTTQAAGIDTCIELGCAVEIGKNLGADQVVLCKLARLGEKIIVQYLLADVSTQKPIVEDRLTAAHVEDLDAVMKRVAISLVTKEPVEKTAEVGVITEQETLTPRRRSTRKTSGFSFGYLYPQNGYDDSRRTFAMDFRTGAELENYAVGMQLFIRKGFGMNVFTSYLFSKKDVCPYLGGAFGFHWVSHAHGYGYYDSASGQWQEPEEKEDDGFELNLDGGVRLFHTYNFQILFNLGYSYTLNGYGDQAILFTIGLLK